MPLTVSGKRGQSSGSNSADEPMHKVLRQEINGLKSLIHKMTAHKGKADGKGKGQSKSIGNSTVEAHSATASGSGSASSHNDLKEFKDKEILRFKTDGQNGKAICQFFQRRACTRKSCKFAHVCWRCHKPEHGIVDCSSPPRFK